MSGDEVRVEPADLRRKASQIRGLSWSAPEAQPQLITPDALVISSVAITNLSNNADALWASQKFGKLEGDRLAQTLDNVATAYEQIDQIAGENIGSTFDAPGGAPNATVYPPSVDLPAPPHPGKMPIPKGQLASDQGFMTPTEAQRALDAGDDGASLRAAAAMWRGNSQTLAASAEQFEVNSTNWEGEAADAAYARFNSYRDWLISLSGSWKDLADEADKMVDAHNTAKSDHRPIADRYAQLEKEAMQNPIASPGFAAAMNQIAQVQKQSEELRNGYARAAQPRQIEPEDPPPPVLGGIPVSADDHRRARPYQPDGAGQPGGGGGGQQASGGGSGGAPQQTPPPAPTSPMSAGDQAAQAAQAAQQAGQQAAQKAGESAGGGQPGGGQQGGSPGGGAPGGGLPGLGDKGGPKGPADPRLRPASLGKGGMGSGGGGGGGMPGAPLQPAVSAETVAPSPYAASAGPAAGPGAAGSGGGAAAGGGGMGGMAPMHGAHGGGAGDKKRNPQLSQDEEIYVEERPHTEPVIGLQPRRRGGADGTRKDS